MVVIRNSVVRTHLKCTNEYTFEILASELILTIIQVIFLNNWRTLDLR